MPRACLHNSSSGIDLHDAMKKTIELLFKNLSIENNNPYKLLKKIVIIRLYNLITKMINDFFMLSLNNLKKRRLRSWLTMIGIFIGIAAVVSLISLGQGLKTAVTGQFASLSTDKLTIQNTGTGLGPPGSTVTKKLNEHDLKIIKGIQGVNEVVTRLLRMGKIEYNNAVQFKYIADIPEDDQQIKMIYDSMGVKVDKGRLLRKDDYGKVVLGADAIKKNDFDKEIEVGKKIKINDKEFEVIGIMKKSSSFQVNMVILMTNSDMKKTLNIGDEYDIIIAQVDSPNEMQKVTERIENALRSDRGLKKGEEDFSVETPLEALKSVNSILNAVNVVIIGIAAISLIVGGIGIANTMYTSVLERKKEIGTMKAIGAKNSQILLIFLLESGLLGLVGGLIGVSLGSGIAYGISSIANGAFGENIFVINISPYLIIYSVLFSFFIGIISGVTPSIQASKLKPVDALKG
jgi:putative ABC transport system permease protein